MHAAAGRGLDGAPARHRPGHDDRRPRQARRRSSSATRRSCSPTATASPTSTSRALLAFHRSHGKLATVTAVRPAVALRRPRSSTASRVGEFTEKPQIGDGWINGGFFVFEPGVLDYLDGDECSPRARAARAARRATASSMAYRHDGFWQRMDTLRDVAAARTSCGSRARPPGRSGRERRAVLARPADARHRRRPACVGGWLVRACSRAGADVVCLVRDWVPQSELVRSRRCSTASRVVRGDVRDQALLERALGEYEIDTVFHLAAQTIVGIANRNPVSTFETNIAGHLGAARGLPPQPARSSRSSSPRPTRRTATRSVLPYAEDDAARRAGTPTTSASRAPT